MSGGNSRVRKLIEEKRFLFGGRILANRGLSNEGRKITYSNCYVISPPEDEIESIFECAKKLARTYSYGGGCGIDISKLAPKGSAIRNAAKTTSGAVSFMDLYSMVTGLIGQEGRRGALMLSMSCDHPDIEDFISIKNDLDKVTYANISVRITDEFMKAVKNDDDYILSFTREATGEVITKKVKARDLYRKFCENNWNNAEPGMLFWNRITDWNLLSNTEEFEFAGTNPCVSGDTLILTDHGYLTIEQLVGKEVNIWNGYQYSKVIPKVTGHNQPMKSILFSDGSKLRCTNYHKFILNNSDRIEAEKLKVGDKLSKFSFPVIDGSKRINKKIAYTQGFFMGDGSMETNRDRLSIKLYGEKRGLIDYIEHVSSVYCPSFDGDFLTLPFTPNTYNKQFVPDAEYDISTRLNWLSGLIDSDGTLQSNDGGISISSTNRELLSSVKYMLNTLGCNGTISKVRNEGYRKLPENNNTGSLKNYFCNTSYRIVISSTNVKKLIDLGLNLHRVPMIANPNRDASRFVAVVSIEDDGICDTVYCFNEPINHSGIFNGIMTAQCAEEPLPAGGSCLLGSMNLAEYVEGKQFDCGAFNEDVKTAIVALNEVLDEGLYLHPLQEQIESVSKWRQTGLGIMGLADMLIKMEIPYGSQESIDVSENIVKLMANSALRASAILAKESGAYPGYNSNDVLSTEYLKTIATPDTVGMIHNNGLRNSQLLTIAPTGTLSTMIGVSGGLEPIFANSYTRTTKSLHNQDVNYKVYTPIVKCYMEENNISDDCELPDWFVTASTIKYEDRIKMQGVWQKYIDASISSTVNLPKETTIEDVEKLYMEAWENGLKGITIFRNDCRRVAILNTPSEEKEENHEPVRAEIPRGVIIEADDNVVGLKRKLTTGCGSLHCTAFFDPVSGELMETYLSKGSTGGCNQFMIGLSRTISLLARSGVDIDSITDQLNSCGTCPSYAVRSATKKDVSKGSCCPAAIGIALKDMYGEMQSKISYDEDIYYKDATECVESSKVKHEVILEKCPQCGENTLAFESGCNSCKSCGYSKCG